MFIRRDEKQIETYGELTLQDVFEVVVMDDDLSNTESVDECFEHLSNDEFIEMHIKQKEDAKVLIENNEMDSVIQELDDKSQSFLWIYEQSIPAITIKFVDNQLSIPSHSQAPIDSFLNLAKKFDASFYNEFNRKVEQKPKKKKSFLEFIGFN